MDRSEKKASLVIQWMRVCLPVQGTWVQSLVWEDCTCCCHWPECREAPSRSLLKPRSNLQLENFLALEEDPGLFRFLTSARALWGSCLENSMTEEPGGLQSMGSQIVGQLRGSQAPRRAVCGTRGSLRTMHGGGSAPSCCAFTHRVAFGRLARQGRSEWF